MHTETRGIYFGWIALAGIFLVTAVTCGAFYSFGVFFVPLMNEFGWTRAVTSGSAFAGGMAYAVVVPLIGMAADRFEFKWVACITASIMGLGFFLGSQVQSVWQLILFVGILPGIGACAAIPLPLSMVTRWFVRRQGLALGIASAGIGTGAGLVPLLATFLISEFGWRMAFAVIGLMIWIVYTPIILFVVRNPDPAYVRAFEGEEPFQAGSGNSVESDSFTLIQAAATKQFWFLFIAFGFCILCLALIMTHVVPFALDSGLSAISAASVLSISAACSIAGRLAAGIISDRVGAKAVLFVGLAIQGLMILWLTKAGSLWTFYMFAVLFGIAYGGNLVMIPKLTASIFGRKSMSSIYGGLSVGDGLGFAIGPLVAGHLFDVSGSYQISFVLAAAGLFIAALLMMVLKEQAR